jgi:hypothetical protein
MIKSPQITALAEEGFHFITAITKPQIEALLTQGVLQMSLFDAPLAEVTTTEGQRYMSYAGFWVMGDQAARFAGASMTSMPSWNLTPPMTFGN